MVGNIVVNAILAGILFVAYSWTPWASLALATLSSLAFSHIFIFDRAFLEEIAKQGIDKSSLLIGAGVIPWSDCVCSGIDGAALIKICNLRS